MPGVTDGRDGSGMDGKYCIVTGSNSGIGFEVARGLMQRGAHVVMACRNMTACEQAASSLRGEGLPGSCVCRRIDLEDLDSVRSFVQQQAAELRGRAGEPEPDNPTALGPGSSPAWGQGSGPRVPPAGGAQYRRPLQQEQGQDKDGAGGGKRPDEAAPGAPGRLGAGASPSGGWRHVDVLVNNAGVMGTARAADGSDRHLAANHLGPYLLTRLMLPYMTHGSRVVNVASRAHYWGSLSLVTDPRGREAVKDNVHHWFWQYARSKLCNVLFTAELQRRYGYGQAAGGHGSGGGVGGAPAAPGGGGRRPVIGACAVSPGMVDTGIFRYLVPYWAQWLRAPLRAFTRTPKQGAEVVLYAACSPELQDRTALFLHDCREMEPSAAARDPRLAADLWRVSAALVGLSPDDDNDDRQ